MPSEHAKLSPSGAKIWLNCGGSVRMSASVVDTGSIYSDTGTAGHEVFRSCAAGETKPADWIGRKVAVKGGNEIEITEELVEHVITALEFVDDFRETYPGAEVRLESRYEIGKHLGLPEGVLWGTADFSAMIPYEAKIVVADLKLGFVDVDVEANEQIILYGIGLAKSGLNFQYEEIELVILQPKKDLAPKKITYSEPEMRDFMASFNAGAINALHAEAPLVSGEWCRFCKAAGACPELRKQMLAIANREFSSLYTMTGSEIGELLTKAKMIEGGIRSLRSHALKLLEIDPAHVPGWKRVQGEKKRRFKEPERALTVLEELEVVVKGPDSIGLDLDEIAPRKLASPLQVETRIAAIVHEHHKGSKPKVTKKKAAELASELISNLVERPDGEPTLVPEDDKREPLAPVFTAEEVAEIDKEHKTAAGEQVLVLTAAEEMFD